MGWGGLADAFQPNHPKWINEYQELKSLLSPEEYQSAQQSTINAHFTAPLVIEGIYTTLERFGFAKGKLLDPALGTGNFFGMLPESMSMKDVQLHGVELDSITGRIAKQLYPKADISIQGYQDTNFPKDYFDVAVGNVPFGDYTVTDKKAIYSNFNIHDYFFAKTLDHVKDGGVIAFVTSSGTMDKKSSAVREYLSQQANLLGAVCLPNNAFLKNANTGVTADILFLQKTSAPEKNPNWIHLGEINNGVPVNKYFEENP